MKIRESKGGVKLKRTKFLSILLTALLLLTLPACGGYQTLTHITARDGLSGQSFSAKLVARRGEVGGSFTSFVSSDSLIELKEKIQKRAVDAENIDTVVYQEQYILFTKKEAESSAFFLLARVPNAEGDEQPRYALFAPVASFGQAETGGGESLVYFPYHLVKNAEIQMYPGQSVIPEGTAYPADAEIDAFEAFYQALAAGETQREGDVLKVKNTKSGKTMQLTFYEGQGRKMVRFSAAPSAEN